MQLEGPSYYMIKILHDGDVHVNSGKPSNTITASAASNQYTPPSWDNPTTNNPPFDSNLSMFHPPITFR